MTGRFLVVAMLACSVAYFVGALVTQWLHALGQGMGR